MSTFAENHVTYTKINTLYKRYTEGELKNCIILGDYSNKEVEYLKDLLWECTEKVDGTNCFIFFDGENIEYHGKTENASIPSHLLDKMRSLVTIEQLQEVFPVQYDEDGNKKPLMVRIYGEGYGVKIQKGGNYIKNDVNMILFDISINGTWLDRSSVEDIANKLNLQIVPIIGYMTIAQAEEYVKNGFKSTIAENQDYEAEGLVCKPMLQLFDKMHRRIICKIKTVDYRNLENKLKSVKK
jgi:hypothetical protein